VAEMRIVAMGVPRPVVAGSRGSSTKVAASREVRTLTRFSICVVLPWIWIGFWIIHPVFIRANSTDVPMAESSRPRTAELGISKMRSDRQSLMGLGMKASAMFFSMRPNHMAVAIP